MLRGALGEFVGTALLVCVIVGSGLMGAALSADLGVVLLINATSTVLALGLLILILAPISGAHLNPVVTVMELLRKRHSAPESIAYIVAQIAGAIAGTMIANVMFSTPALQFSDAARADPGTLVGELLATAGLIIVIGVLSSTGRGHLIALAVPAWIGSAYFFTSSTSFANPAVTLGRMFTDSFTGIAPPSVLPFIAAQLLGALVGLAGVRALVRETNHHSQKETT